MERVEKRNEPGAARTPVAGKSDRQALEAIREYVAAHLDGDLTLAALARRAGMSTSCFSRWFRDQAGVTPHAFVVAARVDGAKELLRASDLTPLEVALAVGFSSQSCLNVAFRRRTGMTPTDYRRQVSTKTKDVSAPSVRRSSTRTREQFIAK